MERMKYIRLLWLVLPFLWQSCAEDKGNYDYRDLNDLNISFDDAYSAISREPFVIKPEVLILMNGRRTTRLGARNRLCWVRL